MKFPQVAFRQIQKKPTFAETYKSKSSEWWHLQKNQREFLEGLATALKLRDWKGWYSVTTDKVAIHGGLKLLNIYGK